MHMGMAFAATAYLIWGLFPLYFKALQTIPASEILIHRMVWSLLFLFLILAIRRQWGWLFKTIHQPRVLIRFLASASLIAANWYLYIWAINIGRVVDTSLGYFINPLFSILLGYLVLHERLRRGQWYAVALAAMGVAWLTWYSGQIPWIALGLSVTFGSYGLLRKTAALGALEGLTLETLLLFPCALAYWVYLEMHQQNHFLTASMSVTWLLIAAGPITAIPLLFFAAGARRIPLSLLGLLQYIGPTLQLLLGIWLYHEPFNNMKLVGFSLIWAALFFYSAEGFWWSRNINQTKGK